MHIFFNFIFAAVSDSTSDDLGDKPVQFSSVQRDEAEEEGPGIPA